VPQQEQGQVAVPVETTNVEVSAKLSDGGEEIKIEIPIRHGKGTHEAYVLAQALQVIKQLGGLSVDAAGNLEFYPITAFKPPFKFEVKRISLVTQ
jgi:hypothetical protein